MKGNIEGTPFEKAKLKDLVNKMPRLE